MRRGVQHWAVGFSGKSIMSWRHEERRSERRKQCCDDTKEASVG